MANQLRMLCVDDHVDLRNSLKEQFAAEDFAVDTADDGDVALGMIKQTDYDVVLLDMKMKKMDGMTVLKELKKIGKYPNVIMLTAVADVPTAIECVKLGAKDYVSKPYDPEELLRVVIGVLGT